jgi:hypothetical protein
MLEGESGGILIHEWFPYLKWLHSFFGLECYRHVCSFVCWGRLDDLRVLTEEMAPVGQLDIRIGIRTPRVRIHTLFARRGKVGGGSRIDRL